MKELGMDTAARAIGDDQSGEEVGLPVDTALDALREEENSSCNTNFKAGADVQLGAR